MPGGFGAGERPRTVLTIHWGAADFRGTELVDAAIRNVLLEQLDTLSTTSWSIWKQTTSRRKLRRSPCGIPSTGNSKGAISTS